MIITGMGIVTTITQAKSHFRAMRKLASEHPSEKVGEEIRKLYSWNGEDKLINN